MVMHKGIEHDDIVDKHEPMNPETDELFYADELEDGMRVLTVSTLRKSIGDHYDLTELRKSNRWCTVTKLRAEGNSIIFIGVYDDGNKERHSTGHTDPWLVKKDTIPVRTDEEPSGTMPSWVDV